MKRLFFAVMLAIAISAGAQTPTYIVPQSVTPTHVFTGVSTAQASGCLANQGQNVHFVFYQSTGATGNPTGVQIRLEGSFNSDSATCSTGTWFPISDDGIDTGQNGSNLILAIQSYPFIRLNLVKCTGCDVSDTIDAWYTASSSMPGNPFGAYGAGQQIRRTLYVAASTSPLNSPNFVTPYGSTAGYILITSTGVLTGGTFTTRCMDAGTATVTSFSFTAGSSQIAMPQPSRPCNLISTRCTSCTNGGTATFSAFYFFYPPGTAAPATSQPAVTNNSETSAVNATASVTLTPQVFERSHVFSLNARCSAGTAGLAVVDTTTSTNLWTSGATEVGTSTFKFQWNPGLAGAPGDVIQVQLTTCGAANTGTLDVQGSVGP